MRRYEHLIVKNLPQFKEVEGHHEKAPFWLTEEMFPEVKIRVAAKDCSKMVNKPHADPHRHDVPEVYLAITEYPGDMKCQILLEDESYVLESPFSVFIPAGVHHAFKVLKCDHPNYLLGIILEYMTEK
jgi:mannose-6-phosphate isomerase-like protein (cupin superfamily)